MFLASEKCWKTSNKPLGALSGRGVGAMIASILPAAYTEVVIVFQAPAL